MAGRIRLNRRLNYRPAVPQTIHYIVVTNVPLMFPQMHFENTVPSLIGFSGRYEPSIGEGRRGIPCHTCPSRMQPLIPGTVFNKLLTGHRCTTRHALRRRQLRRIEPEQLPRQQRGREMTNHACCVITVMMKPEIRRLPHTDGHLHPRDIGRQ